MSTLSPAHLLTIGVGFDTSRYGHHVTFLREDLQPACPPFEFPESHAGYQLVRQQFLLLRQRFPAAHFHIRLDAAGQYATNLEVFLRGLPVPLTLTVGEPARNQHYRKALFPKRKADPVESLCAARFALVEKPRPTAITPTAFYHLREIVARLEGQTRLSTRLTNQLHNLLARIFPELALIATNFQTSWVLRLLSRYPTPQHIVRAGQTRLTAIPYLTADKADKILAAATTTVASFAGATAATLVRQLVAQLRHSRATEADLKTLMTEAYQQLPLTNHLDSIPGIGIATAAVLTAKIVAIDRFATPAQLVGYFGIFAEENSSGIGKDGQAKQGRHCHMSRKGNDLARKYLWNAAKTAITHNPAIRALYQRLRSRQSRRRGLGTLHAQTAAFGLCCVDNRETFRPSALPLAGPGRTGRGRQQKNRGPQSGHKPCKDSGHRGRLQYKSGRPTKQDDARPVGQFRDACPCRRYRFCRAAGSGQHGTSVGPSGLARQAQGFGTAAARSVSLARGQ